MWSTRLQLFVYEAIEPRSAWAEPQSPKSEFPEGVRTSCVITESSSLLKYIAFDQQNDPSGRRDCNYLCMEPLRYFGPWIRATLPSLEASSLKACEPSSSLKCVAFCLKLSRGPTAIHMFGWCSGCAHQDSKSHAQHEPRAMLQHEPRAML